MKKITLILATLFIYNLAVSQTLCYKHVYNVNKKTGVKSESSHNSLYYYTFNANKSYCYLSDENGMKMKPSQMPFSTSRTKGANEYNYVRKENGMYIFKATEQTFGFNPMAANGQQLLFTQYRYLYFSSDYKRLNTWDDKPFGPFFYDFGAEYSTVMVYEQTTPPGQLSTPTQMW